MKIQLIKPLFLLLGLVFVISCQEDFINEENLSIEPDQSKKLFIDYKTIDQVMKEESALKRSVQKIQQNKKDLTSSVYNFSFDENKVQIMQDSTYTQYTFLIKRDNPTDYRVENYICRVFENDSVQQLITSYPVIETQDSLEIDYLSGSIQEIQDDAIDVSKMAETCVPVFTEITQQVIVPCTSPDAHQDEGDCDCGDMDSCEPPSTTIVTTTYLTLECDRMGGGDSGDGYDGPNNNDPNGPSYGGGNNNSDSSDYPILTDPVEPETLLKLPVREYIENLDDEKKDCYENSNGIGSGAGSGLNSMQDDIDEFLNENTTNGVIDPEAQAFVDAILEDCSENVIENAYEIDEPDIPILDMEDYLDCFDTNSNATVTIYVQEPSAGSGTVVNFPNGVGHAFIGISQGSNQASYGFYPEDSAKLGDNSGDTGRFGNDSDTEFTVSISVDVDGDTLESIIDSSQYTNPTLFPPGVPDDFTGLNYDTYDNNCSDFVLSVANDIGLNFNDTYSDYPLDSGGGNNPGALGQAIREGNFNNSNIETPEIETDPDSNNNTPPNNNC